MTGFITLKKVKLLILTLILGLSAFSSPLVSQAFAAVQPNCQPGEVYSADFRACIPTDPVGFTTKFYSIGLGILTFVAIIFIIIGAYYIMTSRGNPEAVNKGKSFIFYSIAGMLLAVLGFVFIETVTGVLKIPGFS